MKFGKTVLLITLFFSLQNQASADEVEIGTWQVSGSEKWRITFPPPASNNVFNQQGSGASELSYPHSGTYITYKYISSPTPKGHLSLEAGFMGKIETNIGSDTDWDYGRSNPLWYYGTFDTAGSSKFVNIGWHKKVSESDEIFYGYHYRNNRYIMTNGMYHVSDGTPQNPPEPLPDLYSTYNTTYHGPHIGANTVKEIAPRIDAVGSIAYSPLTAVRGHGWWNLRQLDFVHTGPGQMVDASIGVRYTMPNTMGSVTLGYRYQWLDIFTGWENTSPDITWDKASNIQQGLFVSGAIHF